MNDTNILLNPDFCDSSVYRSKQAEEKLLDWCAWAEKNLTTKELNQIERALQKQGRGRL